MQPDAHISDHDRGGDPMVDGSDAHRLLAEMMAPTGEVTLRMLGELMPVRHGAGFQRTQDASLRGVVVVSGVAGPAEPGAGA